MHARVNLSTKRIPAAAAALVMAAAALTASSSALADRGHWRHGYGGSGGHYWHGGPRVSIQLGAPLYPSWHYAPPRYYAPPPVYYAPRVVVPAPLVWVPPVVHAPRVYVPPTVYVERTDLDGVVPVPAPVPAPAPAPAVAPPGPSPEASGSWFFCADSNTYYPYVIQCATPWQRVVPTPPGVSR